MTRIQELDRDIYLIRAASCKIEARRARQNGSTDWAVTMEKQEAMWRAKVNALIATYT